MKNLLNLIYKYHFFLLFLLLEGVAVSMGIRYNLYQKASFVTLTENIAAFFNESISSFTDYFNLVETNRKLSLENTILKNQLQRVYRSDDLFFFGKNDTLHRQKYFFTSARVISNGVTRNYTSVLSVINLSFHVSAKLKKNNYFGTISWDGRDYRTVILNEIPYHVDVKRGDTVVTSGYSAIFPEGIPVGTVEEAAVENGSFYRIKVRLFTDFRHLTYVDVIRNLQKEEQQKLKNHD